MTSTALVPVAVEVELLEAREIERLPHCGACGQATERLRRLGGVGRPLCVNCYQRARRAAEAVFDDLRTAALEASDSALYSFLVGKGLAPRSIQVYQRSIWSAEKWFAKRQWSLARATPTQTAQYAKTKPASFPSQSLLRVALGHYWELAEHPRPPLRAIRVPPKATMVCRALEEDDARILAKAARARGDRKGAAVLLGLYQAMRREEIATTRWDAIDGEWITVVGKGVKTRTIPFHPVAREALESLPRSDPYVFAGRVEGHVTPSTIWGWARDVSQEAGIGWVRPHWLRHTALATSNDATGDLRTVQHFAGHSRPETTSGYTRATRARLQEAVRAIDY